MSGATLALIVVGWDWCGTFRLWPRPFATFSQGFVVSACRYWCGELVSSGWPAGALACWIYVHIYFLGVAAGICLVSGIASGMCCFLFTVCRQRAASGSGYGNLWAATHTRRGAARARRTTRQSKSGRAHEGTGAGALANSRAARQLALAHIRAHNMHRGAQRATARMGPVNGTSHAKPSCMEFLEQEREQEREQ